MSDKPVRILLVEDREMEAELLLYELRKAGYRPDWQRVDNERDYIAALDPSLDAILADFSLPGFDAPRALALLKERRMDVPFIVVSGSISEDTAVLVLKNGAADYLLKDRLTRLPQAVQRAMDERELERAKRSAEKTLRATEERMRFALDASRVGIWETDIRSGVTRWSEILEAHHGLPAGTFAGTREAFLDRIHVDDRETARTEIDRSVRDHTDVNLLYRTEWPDGSIHWISGVGRATYDDAGEPVRAAGVGLDVTDRVALEDHYRQAQKMDAIGKLAGGVAHDFNNLLTAIEGYYGFVVEKLPPDHPARPDLDEIHFAAERAVTLTRQLLAFGRRQVLTARVLDLRHVLAGIAPMLRRLIGEDISINTDADADVGRIKADAGQIEQVLLNLSVNARDAMPKGGKLRFTIANVELDALSVSGNADVVPGPYVMLAAGDTGVGMPRATLTRIFEPFFTTKAQGTGLGLATVYGIVKQSGGHIAVESELGEGTTFRVYLPRVDDPVDSSNTVAVLPAARGSESILVVEDDAAVSELVRRTLEHLGYRVFIAMTPSEALQIGRGSAATIDLLIADVILPQMSGSTLARAFIKQRSGLKVLYMSGYTDDAIVHHGVLEEGVAFLQKPFTADVLARKVRDVLDNHQCCA